MTDKELLEQFETQTGEVGVLALQTGGEELLDKVMANMGVAYRHMERVREGVFVLNPQIQREIRCSIGLARKLIAHHKEQHASGEATSS